MISTRSRTDIVMLGTFAAWRAGTIQARALPFARILQDHGFQVAIVTTPWDDPECAGQIDLVDGIPIINTTAVSPLQTASAVREQLQIVANLQPQAVHVIKPRGFGGLAAERLLHASERPRIVVDADDWEGDGGWNDAGDYPIPMRRLFNWQESRLLQRADFVIAASSLIATRARRLRSDDQSIALIPNGIDASWRMQLQRSGNEQRLRLPNRILIYSRFQEFEHDWIDRFAASLQLKVEIPVEIVLIGAVGLAEGVVQHSHLVTIINLGWVDRRQLPETLASGSVAIFPLDDSLISRAKQSVKLIELMAAGCVVIASDVGEVRATLGDAGITISHGSPENFASKTAMLLSNSDQRSRLSRRASARAQQFDTGVVADALPDIYRDLGVEQS